MHGWPGLRPDPAGGAYRAPRPLARFYGGEEGERMGREGKGKDRRKGRVGKGKRGDEKGRGGKDREGKETERTN